MQLLPDGLYLALLNLRALRKYIMILVPGSSSGNQPSKLSLPRVQPRDGSDSEDYARSKFYTKHLDNRKQSKPKKLFWELTKDRSEQAAAAAAAKDVPPPPQPPEEMAADTNATAVEGEGDEAVAEEEGGFDEDGLGRNEFVKKSRLTKQDLLRIRKRKPLHPK